MSQIDGIPESGAHELIPNPSLDINSSEEVKGGPVGVEKARTSEIVNDKIGVGEPGKALQEEQKTSEPEEVVSVEPSKETTVSETAIIHNSEAEHKVVPPTKLASLHNLRMRGYGAGNNTEIANNLVKQYQDLLKKAA